MEPTLTPGQCAHFVWRIQDTLRSDLVDAQFILNRELIEISSIEDLKNEIFSITLDSFQYELHAVDELSQEKFENLMLESAQKALKVAAQRFPELIHQFEEHNAEWISKVKNRAYEVFLQVSNEQIATDFEQLFFSASLATRRSRHLGLNERFRDDFVDSIEEWFIEMIIKRDTAELPANSFENKNNLEDVSKLVRGKARMAISLLGVMPKRNDAVSRDGISRLLCAAFEGWGIYGDEGAKLCAVIDQHIDSEVAKIIHSKDSQNKKPGG